MTELFVIVAAFVLVACLLLMSAFLGEIIGGLLGIIAALVVFFGGAAGIICGFGSILDRK